MFEVVATVDKGPMGSEVQPLIPTITAPSTGSGELSIKYDHPVFSEDLERSNVKNPLERDVHLDSRRHIYDFKEILEAEDVESYIRTTFRLTIETCMRQGYSFVSNNPNVARIIEKRLRIIARKSQTNLYNLVESGISAMTKYNNFFMVLTRKTTRNSGPFKEYRENGRKIKPISGMFVAEPFHMFPERKDGKVVKWHYRNDVTGAKHKEFNPEDVFHVYWDKKIDSPVGTPWILPALDDVRVLRRMEEYLGILVEKHLFPLFQYKVGTKDRPASVHHDEGGSSEVRVIESQMGGQLPTQGVVFTSERHEIVAINTDNALDLEPYLNYAEKRALGSCMLSEVELGRGGTANRGTATTINKNRVNTSVRLQKIFSEFFNEQILYSLTRELGLDPFNEDQSSQLVFNPIDTEEERAQEQHEITKWQNNLVTHDEARKKLRMKPVDDPKKWENMFMNIVQRAHAEQGVQSTKAIEKTKAQNTNSVKPANQTSPQGSPKKKVAKNDK